MSFYDLNTEKDCEKEANRITREHKKIFKEQVMKAYDITQEDIEQKFDTTQDRVEYLLRTFPIARNNDKYLIFLYWKHFDNKDFKVTLQELEGLTNPETIRRTRQKSQAEGRFPALKSVTVNRLIKEKEVRRWSVL